MTSWLQRSGLLALSLLLGGCTQWFYRFGDPLPAGYEARAAGQPMAAVLAELGPPLRYARTPTGLAMVWEEWRIKETGVGLSLGIVGVDLLEFDWGDARVNGDLLLLLFDGERRVSDAARIGRDQDFGGGAALQPFSGFVSVVDVDDLIEPLPQHSWGDAQLRRLPELLNTPQRPGLGDGIEQRGTPTGAGGRSLEY